MIALLSHLQIHLFLFYYLAFLVFIEKIIYNLSFFVFF